MMVRHITMVLIILNVFIALHEDTTITIIIFSLLVTVMIMAMLIPMSKVRVKGEREEKDRGFKSLLLIN